MEKTIQVTVKRIKGTNDSGKAYDFFEFTGATKSGLKCKFKFTKNAKNALVKRGEYPDSEGVFDMKLNDTDISRDDRIVYPEYWVRDVIEFKPHNADAKRVVKPCEDF